MIPGKEVKIGGAAYIMPPLTLGMLEVYQDRIDAFQSGASTNSASWTTVIDCVHAALKRNYPDLPRTVITDNVEMRHIGEIFEALMSVSGVEAEPGKATAGQ